MSGLSTLAIAASGTVVAMYWAYTLLEWHWLRPILQPTVRTATLIAALLLATIDAWVCRDGTAASQQCGALIANMPIIAVLTCTSAGLYAWRRQWLLPQPAALLTPTDAQLQDNDLVAVLSDGTATAIGWLERARTARIGTTVLMHCGLSRGTSAYKVAVDVPMKALLPHKTGYWIGDQGTLWDGIDGTTASHGLLDASPLQRVPLLVCSLATWRQRWPSGQLVGPKPILSMRRSIKAVTKSARNVSDGARWGIVQDERWRALGDAELRQALTSAVPSPCYYLARWAAIARGLPLENEDIEPAAPQASGE